MFEDTQYADLPELLVNAPETPDRPWCSHFLFSVMETGGRADYRSDRAALTDRTPEALQNLGAIVGDQQGEELDLLLRVLFTVPWARTSRDSGLTMRASDVVETVIQHAPRNQVAAAFEDVVRQGPACVRDYMEAEIYPERRRKPAMVFVIGRVVESPASRQIAMDRLHSAIVQFRPHRWEANLRAIVPAWLAMTDESDLGEALSGLLARTRRNEKEADGQYLALGLADWACGHPDHRMVAKILDLVLAGRGGGVRKGAVDLAAAIGRTDVLQDLGRNDPDRSVRERALKRLGLAPGQTTLF